MRNIKLEQNLAGDEHWPFLSIVRVPGDSSATPIPKDATQQQAEEVIQSWHRVAVLRIEPVAEVYFGFIIAEHAQFLNVSPETKQGQFGAHLGDADVSFFIFAKDMKARPTLKLVEVTNMDNPKYTDLPLY